MPASHRAHHEWTPQRLIAWGERIGVPLRRVCAGKWTTGRIPSRAIAPAWDFSAWLASSQRLAWKRPVRGLCRSPRHLPQRRLDPEERPDASPGSGRAALGTAIARQRARTDYYH